MFTFVIATCLHIYAATVRSQHLSAHLVIPWRWPGYMRSHRRIPTHLSSNVVPFACIYKWSHWWWVLRLFSLDISIIRWDPLASCSSINSLWISPSSACVTSTSCLGCPNIYSATGIWDENQQVSRAVSGNSRVGSAVPVFGHGQFYVGVSRGTNWSRVKVLPAEDDETMNIVYKDLLLWPDWVKFWDMYSSID